MDTTFCDCCHICANGIVGVRRCVSAEPAKTAGNYTKCTSGSERGASKRSSFVESEYYNEKIIVDILKRNNTNWTGPLFLSLRVSNGN